MKPHSQRLIDRWGALDATAIGAPQRFVDEQDVDLEVA